MHHLSLLYISNQAPTSSTAIHEKETESTARYDKFLSFATRAPNDDVHYNGRALLWSIFEPVPNTGSLNLALLIVIPFNSSHTIQ